MGKWTCGLCRTGYFTIGNMSSGRASSRASPLPHLNHIPTQQTRSNVGAGLLAKAAYQAPDFPGIIHTNPLAFARSWHNANTTRRSGLSIRLQRVISSTVRWQPVQISSSSNAQILTHGDATGRSMGFILPALPNHAHTAASYAHSAQRWLPAYVFAPRSIHARPCPASPSPANHREFPCPRQSTSWRQ